MKSAARDLVLAICLLALSMYVWYETATYPAPAGEAGAEGLGPAFYPRLLAITLAGLACLVAVAALLRRGKSAPSPMPPASLTANDRLRAAALFGTMVAYWLLMPWLGFVLCTFCFLVAAMLLLATPDRRRRPPIWALVGGCSALATASVFLLFTRVVKVPIPLGRLFGG